MNVKKLTFSHKENYYHFYFVGNDGQNRLIAKEVFIDEYYKSLIQYIGKRKSVIFDIGGHIGTTSVYFAINCPNAMIHTFEPNPNCFNCLLKNTENYKNVKCYNFAVSEFSQKRYLKTAVEDGEPDSFYLYNKEPSREIEVECRHINDLFDIAGVTHVDALKIDIEGAEYEIFISPYFESVASKIDFIIGESHVLPSYPCMIPPLLEPYGFKVKFLPHLNMEQVLQLKIGETNQVKTVKTKIATMFKAWREK